MYRLKATVLVDNIPTGNLRAEWGLSVYIEYNGHTILLDTGASPLFAANASAQGIDLASVEYGVLSHAHFDHAYGMNAFFSANSTAHFYLRNGCAENCYHKLPIWGRYIGIRRGTLKKYAARIVYVSGVHELMPGAYLVPHSTPQLEKIGEQNRMYTRHGLHFVPDNFAHEQSLVFRTEHGLVVFSSCSHGGADNIVSEVSAAFPEETITALIGGFHLYRTPNAAVSAFGARLHASGVTTVYTGHCTGERAFSLLQQEFGTSVHQLCTGLVMEF